MNLTEFRVMMSKIARPVVVAMDVAQRNRNAILGFGLWHADANRFLDAVEWFYDMSPKSGSGSFDDYCVRKGLDPDEQRYELEKLRPDLMRVFERLLCAGEPDEFEQPKGASADDPLEP